MPIVVIGLSHHSSPVTVRERFAISEHHIPETLEALSQCGIAEEAVILSTCNRVELYVHTTMPDGKAIAGLRDFLCKAKEYEEPAGTEIYGWSEPRSVEHLFKVASGLDSMVVGETEVLGQLKKAYQIALERRFTGPRLNKAFQKAFNVAKHIRTHTNIQRGSVSVSSVGVELAQTIFSNLSDRQVMVIGAGDTSEKAARALLSRGAHSILVSNRSYERAEKLARELDGRAIHFDRWEEEFQHVDIVISSTSAPRYILDRPRLEAVMHRRSHRPLLLIDLAVPRDIDPDVNLLDDVYLYNVDDLQAIADDYLRQRKEEIVRCEDIIADKAKSVLSVCCEDGGADGGLVFGHG